MDPSIRKLSLSAVLHVIVPAKREGMLAPLVMLTVCIYRFRPHSRSSSWRAAVLSVPLRSRQPLPDRSGAPVEAIVTVASRRAGGKEMLGHAQAVAKGVAPVGRLELVLRPAGCGTYLGCLLSTAVG